MQKIIPNLWFDNQAEEAAAFYVSLFPDAKLGDTTSYSQAAAEFTGHPAGSVMTVNFVLAGQQFTGINGGPHFSFNPSISFYVECNTKQEVEDLWASLSQDGSVLMPLGTYPFSESFGWLSDKYGVSWQLMFVGDQPITQKITPALLFVGDVCGKAEAAITNYQSLFPNSETLLVSRYPEGSTPDKPGTIEHARFRLGEQEFLAMDSAYSHDFSFNEAVSLLVMCDDQAEIDKLWEHLTTDGEEAPCGWLKDKYGVSWQIVPRQIDEWLKNDDKPANRVWNAMLPMTKIDLASLEAAYTG